jgi:hypothetical protein
MGGVHSLQGVLAVGLQHVGELGAAEILQHGGIDFGGHVDLGDRGEDGPRAGEAAAIGLVVVEGDVVDAAAYGGLCTGVEFLDYGEVFDGQHDDSPRVTLLAMWVSRDWVRPR